MKLDLIICNSQLHSARNQNAKRLPQSGTPVIALFNVPDIFINAKIPQRSTINGEGAFRLTVLECVRRHGIGSRAVSFAIERLHHYAILGIFSQAGQSVIVRAVPISCYSYPRRVHQLIISSEIKPRDRGSSKRKDNAREREGARQRWNRVSTTRSGCHFKKRKPLNCFVNNRSQKVSFFKREKVRVVLVSFKLYRDKCLSVPRCRTTSSDEVNGVTNR